MNKTEVGSGYLLMEKSLEFVIANTSSEYTGTYECKSESDGRVIEVSVLLTDSDSGGYFFFSRWGGGGGGS